ncbi:hypothetical protein C8Q74DRAFT_1562 [Fomes fomentarius]|nr:hypothetical protein C8Q74DRAFT_1562 [Fomes fomentarius]
MYVFLFICFLALHICAHLSYRCQSPFSNSSQSICVRMADTRIPAYTCVTLYHEVMLVSQLLRSTYRPSSVSPLTSSCSSIPWAALSAQSSSFALIALETSTAMTSSPGPSHCRVDDILQAKNYHPLNHHVETFSSLS